MSLIHGKQYKKKIEAMTNRKIEELNNNLIDLSANTFNIVNTVNKLIEIPVNKMALYNQPNKDNIYTENINEDVCNNRFTIKQYINACYDNGGFINGLTINNNYGIYNIEQVGNKDDCRQDEYVDFNSNFRKNINLNTNTIEQHKFNPIVPNNDLIYVVESFDNNELSKYDEVDIPTFNVKDLLKDLLQTFPIVRDKIIVETNTIATNNQNIYQELEKYNRFIRQANLELSSDISLNMNYVNNIEDLLNPENDDALNNKTNLKNIQELKRKLEDEKLVLGYNHNNYILWTLLSVVTLVVLLKVYKPLHY